MFANKVKKAEASFRFDVDTVLYQAMPFGGLRR